MQSNTNNFFKINYYYKESLFLVLHRVAYLKEFPIVDIPTSFSLKYIERSLLGSRTFQTPCKSFLRLNKEFLAPNFVAQKSNLLPRISGTPCWPSRLPFCIQVFIPHVSRTYQFIINSSPNIQPMSQPKHVRIWITIQMEIILMTMNSTLAGSIGNESSKLSRNCPPYNTYN